MHGTTAINYESASFWVAVASVLVSAAAAWIAKSSLSQAKEVAGRDRRDWKQRKWFDLHFKANEAYDFFDYFGSVYADTTSLLWGTAEQARDWNNLMRTMRETHAMAAVFPKNAVIDELFSCTAVFKDPKEALSKERLKKVLDAVNGVRERALVDPSVLDG